MANTRYIVTPSDSAGVGIEEFLPEDLALVSNYQINSAFQPGDYIELHIYSLLGEKLKSIYNYNQQKELLNSAPKNEGGPDTLYIDPQQDIVTYGFAQGDVKLLYHFLRTLSTSLYFIDQISSDRTELKVKTSNALPVQELTAILDKLQNSPYFSEFRLNFSNNELLIGVNLRIEGEDLYIKLYEPLPISIVEKSQFYLVQKVSDSYTFEVQTEVDVQAPTYTRLRSPNFNIDIEADSSTPTSFLNYNALYSYPVTSSYHKLLLQASSSGVEVSVDYTDYSNFVHFSSAQERLDNFRYKVDLIKTYESASAAGGVSTLTTYYDKLISGIVSKFDGYEKYLYFESGAYAWPKENSLPPFRNRAITTTQAIKWYASQSLSASLYDELNESSLEYAIPEYIRQDSANTPYSLFLNMIGQHFDNIWIYIKAVTDKYDADNRLGYGVSKDLVADTLRSFGVKLYNSNFSVANLSSLLLGEWYDSGSEDINSFITASNYPTPDKDILAETYKRIYHNLPYLIKTKGTERGLRALINCFGIPSGSLQIRTYGGVNTLSPTPYYASALPTGSKIRLDNTGSIVSGNTLSYYTSIQKDNKKYTQDINIVEVGFSPAYNIDNFISRSISSSFDLDQYIGDPRYLYSGSYKNDTIGNLYKVGETLLSGSAAYDVNDFIRLIKFFDNQLFKMVKDFVPARDVTTSGIIIKPHVLNRSKVKSVESTGTRPEYTASIDTAFITGSNGGVLADYSTTHSQSLLTLAGTAIKIQNTGQEKINGELGGSVIRTYTGSLNLNNNLKNLDVTALLYDTTGSNGNSPAQGSIFWRSTSLVDGLGNIRGYGVGSIHINQVSKNGISIQPALSNLSAGDTITFTILYDGIDSGSPCGIPVTKTITQTIQSIAFKGNNIWQIQFTETSIQILFFANTGFCDAGITYYSSSDSPVILKPYVNTGNYFNSDYNALHNNTATVANPAPVFRVDYSTNPNIPVNIIAIRSGSAELAEVQELLHTSPGLVSGRYKGRQLAGQQINEYTTGDVSYGKTPVIESTTPYFCIFDYISGFSPEHNQANAIVLSYIIDEEGNVITPDSPVSLPILQQGFPANSEFEISIQSPAVGGSEATLLGTHTILRPAARLEPILFSYTASVYLNPAFSTGYKLHFESDPTIRTYDAKATGGSQSITSLGIGQKTTLVAGTEISDDRGYYDTGTSTYVFGEDTEQPVRFAGTFTFEGDGVPGPYGTVPGQADIKFIKSTDGSFSTATTSVLGSKRITYSDLATQTVTFSTPLTYGSASEAVRAVVEIVTTTYELTFNSKTLNVISQESGSSFIGTGSDGYFFTTGSTAAYTVLTSSLDLAGKYEKYFVGVSGAAVQGFNDPTLPFTVEPGDEIKFNNNEKRSYLITKVETPDQNSAGRLYLSLNGTLPKSVDRNFFAIRRYVNTSNMMLMKIDKVAGVQKAGILYPKYPSPRLKANYEKIISELKNKGIL